MSTCDIWSPQNSLISPEDGVIKLSMCDYEKKFCSVVLQKEGMMWLRITLTKTCIFTKSAFCKISIFGLWNSSFFFDKCHIIAKCHCVLGKELVTCFDAEWKLRSFYRLSHFVVFSTMWQMSCFVLWPQMLFCQMLCFVVFRILWNVVFWPFGPPYIRVLAYLNVIIFFLFMMHQHQLGVFAFPYHCSLFTQLTILAFTH